MKRTIFLGLVLTIAILTSCGNKTPQENKIATNDKTIEKKGAQKINKQEFLIKIMNYEANPNIWKFEGNKPCLVDFYADWCAPCRITGPILEELAIEYHGKIDVYKVDIQKEQELAAIFGVQSIPTFLFCPKEGQPRMSSGIARTPEETRAMFKQMIDEILLNKM